MSASTISAEELRAATSGGETPVLVDVRTPAEWEAIHIAGTVNVPLDRLDEFAPRLVALDRPIVSVCASGQRAQQGLEKLVASGAKDVKFLSGGATEWESIGGECERGAQRWAMDRQVRGVAGSLVLLGLLLGTRLRGFRLIAWIVGAGLTYSALSNSCYMAQGLSMLPYNRTDRDVDADVAAVERRVGGSTDLKLSA